MDEFLGLQPTHRFPHGDPTDAKIFAEFPLDQSLARCVDARRDRIPDGILDLSA